MNSKAGKGETLFPHDAKADKEMNGEDGSNGALDEGDLVEGALEEVTCLSAFSKPSFGMDKPNPCQGKKIDFPNIPCYDDGVKAADVKGQAGADVTKDKQGLIEVDYEPIKTIFNQAEKGLCPVNVHWHQGAEHRSEGEYDESFDDMGPAAKDVAEAADGDGHRMLSGEGRQGFRCSHNDGSDMFTKEYDWKFCEKMHVGETYEVHWPHSAAGACGTIWQFQSDFYDGVFCNIDGPDGIPPDLQNYVGVQAQVFTIVNDEDYYYPDLMRGMMVDGADAGTHITKYTGSTTGDGRDNDESCSQYAAITWQVDRKCHMVSASTFDKMCFDMLNQADDMSMDIYPHGAREVVDNELTSDNMIWDRKRALRQQN